MADMTTTPRSQANSDEIRRDIRRTRSDMDETVDALTERLSPGSILDEVWHRVRKGDGLTSVVRDHPVPLALMGLGLGWLAIEQAKGSSRETGPGTYARAEGRKGPYRGTAVDEHDPDWEHASASTRARGKVSRAAHAASDAASSAASSAGKKASQAASTAGRKASEAASTAKDKVMDGATAMKEKASDAASSMGGSVRSGFWDLLENQPLALGAIAFGLGLAGGLTVPSSDREDELMGRTSETLKDEARRVGRTTAGKAGRVAAATVEATFDEVKHQKQDRNVEGPAHDGLEQLRHTAHDVADEVSAAGKEVARTARETARETADDENLDAASLRAEAETVARRTGEQARKDARRATGGATGDETGEDSGKMRPRAP